MEKLTEQIFSRTERLIGKGALSFLRGKNVVIFGVGGVGGYAAEGLARAGVGSLTLVDMDDVSLSNCNRQIVARLSTLGKSKVDVMAERIADFSPHTKVRVFREFFLPKNADFINFSAYDYVVDCVDTVTAKVFIAEKARACGVPCISAMGAGNRIEPLQIEVCDVEKTHGCALAKVMRRELKKRGIRGVKAAFASVGDNERRIMEELSRIALEEENGDREDSDTVGLSCGGMTSTASRETLRDKVAPKSFSGEVDFRAVSCGENFEAANGKIVCETVNDGVGFETSRDNVPSERLSNRVACEIASGGVPPKTLSDKVPSERLSNKVTPGSISYLPSLMGMTIAGTVICDLLECYIVEKRAKL